jgi:hypothetical protein
MTYPPAPWQLHGQLWVSLFGVRAADHPQHRGGLYGAAFVSYEAPSPLTYSEVLLARLARRGDGPGGMGRSPLVPVEITDIWVDSPDSRDGGRELWAIPKGLASFERSDEGSGVRRTTWRAAVAGRPIAHARFADVSDRAPRTPFRAGTQQRRPDDTPVTAPIRGSARTLPCRATWSFDEQGPLAWLAGKRPLASMRMTDFAMSFG